MVLRSLILITLALPMAASADKSDRQVLIDDWVNTAYALVKDADVLDELRVPLEITGQCFADASKTKLPPPVYDKLVADIREAQATDDPEDDWFAGEVTVRVMDNLGILRQCRSMFKQVMSEYAKRYVAKMQSSPVI